MFQGNDRIPVTNRSMDLSECRDRWTFNAEYDCWCLEDVLYTEKAPVPLFQRLSVYAPKEYLCPDGTPDRAGRKGAFTGENAPVVFVNNAAGYMQMPHTWLGGPRCDAENYLRRGMVYVTAGCRGRESRDAAGKACGKSPATLVDLKTVVRFLRHNRDALPGSMDRIVTVGTSAGGAMSSLLGLTGDSPRYLPLLREAGAFLEESDAVFASQCYCPIIDLDHADQAYEWCFGADKTCEDSPAGPAETMDPFREALSAELADRYIAYVNGLGLRHPETGEPLTLGPDGRSGGFYDYLMDCLSASAADFLGRLGRGELALRCTPEDYLAGRYEELVPAPPEGPANADLHHVGPGAALHSGGEQPKTMGEMLVRPPKGTPWQEPPQRMIRRPGKDKKAWLAWDGRRAEIRDLDTYVLSHRRRMKPCTSFDVLRGNSGENQVMGTSDRDYMHYNPEVGWAIAGLKDRFPEEAARYAAEYLAAEGDEALAERRYLINPMNFLKSGEDCARARHFRLRVGASDADTSLSIAMTLALKLAGEGIDTDYALVWDLPHCDADYPGEVQDWIERICR